MSPALEQQQPTLSNEVESHPGPEPETTGAADMETASFTQTASHEEPTGTDEETDSTTGSSPPPTDSPSQAPVRDCTDA